MMIPMPAFIKNSIAKIDLIDRKKFIRYAAIFIGIHVALVGFIAWRYYSKTSQLKRSINNVNELRQEVRLIREKALQVQNQRSAVNAMLAEEPDFKIAGYFNELLSQLRLDDKKVSDDTTQIDREDEYRESELTASLTDISMQELTLLLAEIEKKQRIYIKKLEVEKSKRRPGTIDVLFTIATLLSKTE